VLQASAQVSDGTRSLVRAQAASDVKAVMPLALSVSINQDPVPALLNTLVLGLVTYEYKVSNLGSTAVSNVVLSDLILNDAALLLSPTTGAPICTNNIAACAPGAVTSWPVFSLGAGQTQTFTAVKQIFGGTRSGTVVRSLATVTSPVGLLSQATDLVVDNAAGLQLSLEDDHDPVKPGEALTYRVIVGNAAVAPLPNGGGLVSATIPSGTTLVSASTGGSLVGSTVQWSVAALAAGANQLLTYTVMPATALRDGTTLQASAQVIAGNTSLVRAQAATDVAAAPPISLVVTAVGAVGSVTFTATITNVSAADRANVALSVLTLNDAQVLLALSTPTPSCTNNAVACQPGGVVSWPSFSLAAGGSQSFTWVSQLFSGTPSGTIVRTTARVTAGTSAAASQDRGILVN
jgi:uncharacterized repeat protein (TIGR01451 family)